MEDKQLKQFSPEEARQQLNDDQLERYNELKEEELQGNIEDDKQEKAGEAAEGLAAMRQSVQGDLTITVRGIEFSTDINPAQINKLVKVAEFEDRKVDSLNEDELETVKGNILDILSELSINHDRSDWQENFGDSGIVAPAVIAGEVLDEVENVMDVKKNR